MLRKNTGFSLTELMTVIGIIALMCGIAMPNLIGWLPKYRMGTAARELMGAMEHARMTAVRRNVNVDVAFDFAANSYRTSVGGKTVRAGSLPPGIDLKEPSSDSIGASFRFNNQGMPVDNANTTKAGKMVIADNGGRYPIKVVSVNAGGNVKIEQN